MMRETLHETRHGALRFTWWRLIPLALLVHVVASGFAAIARPEPTRWEMLLCYSLLALICLELGQLGVLRSADPVELHVLRAAGTALLRNALRVFALGAYAMVVIGAILLLVCPFAVALGTEPALVMPVLWTGLSLAGLGILFALVVNFVRTVRDPDDAERSSVMRP